MPGYEKHFRMNAEDVIEYVREKLPSLLGTGRLVCSEIGDGNVNFVFRVQNADNGRSVIVKQADKEIRSSGRPSSLDRNRIESELLLLENDCASGMVPEVFLFDPVMSCILMEDIGRYENLRYALLERKTFLTLAADMGYFLARTLVGTTDLILRPEKKKELVKRYVNPQMCEISERLVFTEPYLRDMQTKQKAEMPEETLEMLTDSRLILETAKLKCVFQSKAQALVHGDLHSGSIFVLPGSTKVLDPEFAFYGPAGYDIGNVLAHFYFAWIHCSFTGGPADGKEGFLQWVEETVAATVDVFREEAVRMIRESGTDPRQRGEDFIDWYVRDMLSDAAGYAGTELIRRTVGSAGVRDVSSIEPADARNAARRRILELAGKLILERDSFTDGRSFAALLREKTDPV